MLGSRVPSGFVTGSKGGSHKIDFFADRFLHSARDLRSPRSMKMGLVLREADATHVPQSTHYLCSACKITEDQEIRRPRGFLFF
jgi:hypothetical protein